MEKEERIQTTVRIKKDIYEMIEKDANKECRDFTKQLDYIVRQYYEIKKTFKS